MSNHEMVHVQHYVPNERIHSFNVNNDLLICAPSINVTLSFACVSRPRSLPAKSIKEIFP